MKSGPLGWLILTLLCVVGTFVSAKVQAQSGPTTALVLQNTWVQFQVGADAKVRALSRRDGANLLSGTNVPFMNLRIGAKWYSASSLTVLNQQNTQELLLGFDGTSATARALVRVHPDYFEVETKALDGAGAEAVEQWSFVNLPVNLTANIGSWLNVAWDDKSAVAVIALEEKTDARGTPSLQAIGYRSLGLVGRKAAIIACPTPSLRTIIRGIEIEQGLPSPSLRGEGAKTSTEARKSWMITLLAETNSLAAHTPDRVFATAKDLGVEYVVIGLGPWNTTYGHYPINTKYFPRGIESLKTVADRAHSLGLKLGIHVMTGSISKSDSYVTPVPDRRIIKDGKVTLAADLDATAKEIPTLESPGSFGTATGYWAYGGVDVQIDDEIIRYGGIAVGRSGLWPYALTNCVRGAYGTRAASHQARADVQHITERYGWYVANPELAAEIGRNLADIINLAGLDMVCFDGADVTADPATRFYDAHQVPQAVLRYARRDVLLVSNGSSHFGWHCMTRGGEDDAMSRGFKRWVDDYTVHGWGAQHWRNFFIPDFSWVGIFPHTPTLTAARPDDVELVCARSLGYDGAVGWGLAGCYGGASTLDTLSRNGRRKEMVDLIRTYEHLRMTNYFPLEALAPLQKLGTEWRLFPPDQAHDRYRLLPVRYVKSELIRADVPETTSWQLTNSFNEQPLRVRIEALPALATYGATNNVVVADFAHLQFSPTGNIAAATSFQLTGGTHPPAGAVARFACMGPSTNSRAPLMPGYDEVAWVAWAQASATLPTPLNLNGHRALGLWICGDGSGAVLDVRLEYQPRSFLHFAQAINFTGWKYCELGEPESDHLMDYFGYAKSSLHDLALNRFTTVTLMILNPPRGKNLELLLGRIEALTEIGGHLVNPRLTVAGAPLVLPVTLEPEQYLETGDLWDGRDPGLCRVFDPNGQELRRLTLKAAPPAVPAGRSEIQFSTPGQASARAKVTVILLGSSASGEPQTTGAPQAPPSSLR